MLGQMKIITDTREKQPWTFNSYADVETTSLVVKTGDYIIEDFPKGITIDRKKNLNELYINTKEKRFRRELERMKEFDEAYIICSFPYSCYWSWPVDSGIPESKHHKIQVTGTEIRLKVEALELEYEIPFLYTRDKYESEALAYQYLKAYYDKNTN